MKGQPVFICSGARTPVGRYGGGLSAVRPDDLAALAVDAALERAGGLAPDAVDEVVLGCANQAGEDNRNVARMAVLLSRLPQEVPAMTVNRLCAAGLDAIIAGARSIATGESQVVIAGGVESMSRAPFVMGKAESAFSRKAEIFDTTIGWRFVNPRLAKAFGTDAMPETAENLAEAFQIAREDQDAFALRSQQRTVAAREAGVLERDVVTVSIPQRRGDAIVVEHDEHPRETTLEKLAKLPAPFRDGGTITAGNASGVNDGAAALVLASEDAVAAHGLTPRARIVAAAAGGVQPRIMGIGPVEAVKRLCERSGLGVEDFEHIELNEAFAAQVLACTRQWGLPDDAPHLNPNGGAIALGHPLGMSGARITLAASDAVLRGTAKRALVTLCVGVGQGVAMAIEAV